jgi:hypothetical protein
MSNQWTSPWTAGQIERLAQLVADGATIATIAISVDKSETAVRNKMRATGMRPTPENPWDARAVGILRRGHADRLPFSQIADEIGGGMTKNGCIGKAQRLGLPPREPHERAQPPKPRPQRIHRMTIPKPLPVPVQRVSPPTVPDAPSPLRIALLDLSAGQCRWPVTERDPHAFCGHPTFGESSYCQYHFTLSTDRRRDREANANWFASR